MDKKGLPIFAFVSMMAVIVSACIQSGSLCAQVITPATGPSGECREFATPCDVPSGWTRVDSCPEKCPKGDVCATQTVMVARGRPDLRLVDDAR